MAMGEDRLETLSRIEAVMAEYSERMTIRQIYYRLVADYGYENSLQSYKRIVALLDKARLDGTMDYEAIEDRSRQIDEHHPYQWEATEYLDDCLRTVYNADSNFKLPKWKDQPNRVNVMVEKQALQGIFQDVCRKWEVDLMVCKGYPSLTQQYELSKRLDEVWEGEDLYIIYFGDFDPSGENISDKLQERLYEDFDIDFESFEKECLTMEQVQAWNLPPAPAKRTDSRTNGFVEKFGVAWQVELDAIRPNQLTRLINDAVSRHYDHSIGEETRREEEEGRELIGERIGRIREIMEGEDV